MNMHRALLAVVIGLAAAPAPAQEAASLFAPVPSTQAALVAIRGVVSGAPESVSFSGQAKVTSRLAPDPDFFKPRLVLSIDLSGVPGVGSNTGAKYVISGPELMQRHLAASHTIEITFPFQGGASSAGARTGVASFVLDFDVNTGAVIRASGGVSTPNFPR
jgi:hypothetical protein